MFLQNIEITNVEVYEKQIGAVKIKSKSHCEDFLLENKEYEILKIEEWGTENEIYYCVHKKHFDNDKHFVPSSFHQVNV